MTARRTIGVGAVLIAGLAMAGCASIRESRGYIVDQTLVASVHPGIDNKQSVEATLGHPSFISQFGDPTWYYVSSVTARQPFQRPRITQHQVLAVHFDSAGNVASTDTSGMDKVVFLDPDSDKTPTLGRERSFFEDLFGNIGAVGAGGAPAQGSGAPGPNG
jgi:outer membrane protein assembly factor BamE (lipoprotein component of BamABCDE complex)